MEAMEPPLLTQTRGQVAVLTLNRPGRLNAIGRDVLALLAAAVADAAADEQVRALAVGAPLALATGKRLVDRGLGMDLAAAISYEGESVCLLFGTADRVAGLEAFRERRPPAFTGH